MRSLRARLILSAGIWIVLVLAVGGAALSYNFQRSADNAFHNRLEIFLNALIAASDTGPDGELLVVRDLDDPRFNQVLSGWYWQVSNAQGAIVRSRSLWDAEIEISSNNDATMAEPVVGEQTGPRGRSLHTLERSLWIEGYAQPVWFLIAGDISGLLAERRTFDLIIMLSLFSLGGGVLIALLVQVRFGLSPLRRLTDNLEAIHQRRAKNLDEDYPAEVLPLIKVTNSVLDENREQIERARRHVGNLVHALKTPLTLLKTQISAESDPARRAALSEQSDIIANLVEHHLSRAAAAGRSAFAAEHVSVYDVVAPICGFLSKIYAEPQRHVRIDIPATLAFVGERQDLEEMAGNLLENAFKWARRDIVVRASVDENEMTLSVTDDGPGMPVGAVDAALKRGQRHDEMTPGHGLGLSIVADLVELYQGALQLENVAEGGLRATLRFSAARAAEMTGQS